MRVSGVEAATFEPCSVSNVSAWSSRPAGGAVCYMSVWMDLRILLRSVATVLTGSGSR